MFVPCQEAVDARRESWLRVHRVAREQHGSPGGEAVIRHPFPSRSGITVSTELMASRPAGPSSTMHPSVPPNAAAATTELRDPSLQ